ncbi:MAG TPA: signal peptidase II, partial [Candidatus Omnitrophota bacterium]|nr:signal peptidase II [Candidatus Omnitrophota bacterium]
FFISVTILSVAFIIFYIWKHKTGDIFSLASLSLITGGALGNLIDRVIYGHVIDFLDFHIWPVFNVADSAITIGAAILIFKIMVGSLSIGR